MPSIKNEVINDKHLIASHVIPVHNRNEDYDFSHRLGGLNKIVGGRVDVSQISRMYFGKPILIRDHPISEQKDDMMNNPVATGKRHAQEQIKYFYEMEAEAKRRNIPFPTKDKVIFPGINEPVIDAGPRHQMEYNTWLTEYNRKCDILDRYTEAFLDELAKDGFSGAALNLSVGWPANLKDDEPAFWGNLERTHQAILRGNHYLVLHEYWSKKGPRHMWGWWAGRFIHCPWMDVRIIIGECGMDQYVEDGVDIKDSRGFALNVTKEEYVDQIFDYESLCWLDPRIVAIQIFTSDGKTQDWGSFDIIYLYDLIYKKIDTLGKRKRKALTSKPQKPVTELSQSPTDTPFIPFRGRITASVLNVRSKPEIDDNIVNMLSNGAVVDVRSRTSDGWYNIGQDQWVSAQWVAPYIADDELVDSLLENFSRLYKIDPNMVRAAFIIESGNKAFGSNGKPLIRFENHVFFDQLQNPDLYYKYFWHNSDVNSHKWRPDENSEWINFHGNQELEWKVFEFAKTLNQDAAERSMSIGMGQIMGFNYDDCGYLTPGHMINEFSKTGQPGIVAQVCAFFAFCISRGLIDALRQKDFEHFALVYNGAASYASLIKNQYNLLSK